MRALIDALSRILPPNQVITDSLRVVLGDGAVLDTEDPYSVARFCQSHASLVDELEHLGAVTRADEALAARIRHKYKIKNTTGYSLNALVDFEEPIDILAHLMIGSEGTLGFISRITFRTVAEDPFKASTLVFFPSVESACQAAIRLKKEPVSAVELLDRPALRSVEDKPGLPQMMRLLGSDAAALLIEVRAETATHLMRRIRQLFDPQNLLNPGVILNDDPQAHWKNLKPMPAAEERVDRCIECDFCEPLCPSHRLTLSPRLGITRKPGLIALQINCSVRRTATDATLRRLLQACALQIVEPAGVTCCGFGGDRGFVVPELNVHALRKVHDALPANCCAGVSTHRTCETGLTSETGRPYRSIAYLLEECSREEVAMNC